MFFDNMRDAMSRLEGTILFYRNKALYVRGITDDLQVAGDIILSQKSVTVSQQDPELSMACPEVGYINTEHGAHYFMRQPMRRWKQGIDLRALVSPHSGIRARGILELSHLANCLENTYPTFDQACNIGKSLNPFKPTEVDSIAFCKSFSVKQGTEGLMLHYKGREVGVVENGNPVLSTKFSWLNESLESVL